MKKLLAIVTSLILVMCFGCTARRIPDSVNDDASLTASEVGSESEPESEPEAQNKSEPQSLVDSRQDTISENTFETNSESESISGAITAPTTVDASSPIGILPEMERSVPYPTSSQGYDTPEDAVIAYFDALRNSDLYGMLNTFSIDVYMENFDLETYLNRTRYINSDYAFFKSNDFTRSSFLRMLKDWAVSKIANQFTMIGLFESGQSQPESGRFIINDESSKNNYLTWLNALVDAPDFNSLKVLGFVPLDLIPNLVSLFNGSRSMDYFFNENQQNNNSEYIKVIGADGSTDCVAVFEIGGNTYLQVLNLLEYSGKWYIFGFEGNLGRVIEDALLLNNNNLQGLLPLFYIQTLYTGISEKEFQMLRSAVLAVMYKIEYQSVAAGTVDINPATTKTSGFDSPEEAVTAYLEALSNSDFERMISTFAPENFRNLEAPPYYLSGSVSDISWFPNNNEIAYKLSVEKYENRIAKDISSQYNVLCAFESNKDLPLNTSFEDEASIREFLDQCDEVLNSPKLNTINVLAFIPPERFSLFSSALGGLDINDNWFDDEAQNSLKKNARNHYNADDFIGCIAVFEINSNIYLHISIAHYFGGKWVMGQLGGSLSAFMDLPSSYYGLVPISAFNAEVGADVDLFLELLAAM